MELVDFVLPDVKPELIGGIGQGGAVDDLVKRFGNSWRKTPIKGTWCLESPGMQFTIRSYGSEWDIAFYDYETVAEFRKAFESKEMHFNAIYFQTTSGDKYTGVAILRFLKEWGTSLT